ncbi:Tetratricopeptide-like helical [Cordyceps fumosorosea ARSEF 2679]|uniref:Tetratricopeptide-like helical n=1 Tax=Cordyceps fumosorosea (strain ARSEF 2679) TaxID=1081104 RepID=A0A167Q3Q0_CORFA|nr:Tetratricopeptide-like helical [Cordyceps fumosorosea ARSEF 2679]OAA57254.1 Tetratricopeptide-like helical [Cordyceps fumosorosea ARSEF 2679]
MSLKLEIETWVSALGRYDNNEFDEALADFEKIGDTSRILFNMGVIHATLGEHEKAVECYQRAIRLDQYLAVAYFQQGVSNFLLGDFEEALANFNDTLLYLRGNTMIDYAQLGLLFKLYSCEVLFNRGLCYIYLQQKEAGMQDLTFAVKEKVVEDHDVIDDAIREEADGYTVFSIPVGVVYRPNEAKAAKTEVKDDRPTDNISFAATNLVKPGIQSRRQQSEPPSTSRNVFPPTPPPENDRGPSRGASVRNGGRPTLARLNIQPQESNRKYEKAFSPDDGRPSATRSASSALPSRGFSQREPPPLQRRPTKTIEEDTYANSDVYDMYAGRKERESRGGSRQEQRRRPSQRYEEEEDAPSDYDDGSLDGAEFEMVSNNRRGPGSMSNGSRNTSRRPDVRKFRVKVHAEDVRYIMIGGAVEFPDFVDRIRDKFGMRRRFKIKIKDEDMPNGDMITMGDQDDLDMAMLSAKEAAKRQRQEIGKIEASLARGASYSLTKSSAAAYLVFGVDF